MRASLRRLLSTVGASLLLTTLVAGSPATAEPTYSLTSTSVEGTTSPSTTATLSFTLDGALPRRIEANFINKEVGTESTLRVPVSTSNPSYAVPWDARWPAGRYELRSIVLISSGTSYFTERYEADGRIVQGGSTVGQHEMDFAALAYSIQGPQTNELAPAKLQGLKRGVQPPAPGAFSMQVVTSDVELTVRTIGAEWSGGASASRSEFPTGTTTINGYVGTAGHKALQTVTLTDQHSNSSVYSRDGTVTVNGYRMPTAHAIEFAPFDLDVPDLPKRESPQIQTITWKKRSAHAGEPSILTVAVTDDSNGPVLLSGWWTNPVLAGSQGPQDVLLQPSVPKDIPVNLPWAGQNALQSIQLVDGEGNGSTYRRDGTTSYGPGLTGRHEFDLTALDATLRPGTAAVSVRPRPHGARIVWHVTSSDVDTKSSLRVTVSPGGHVIDIPAGSVGGRIVDIPGLLNGTSYTVTMVLRSAWGDGRPTTTAVRPMPSTNVFAIRDATGDGRVDIVARQPNGVGPSGDSFVYPTNGYGAFGRRTAAFRANDLECERVAPGDVYPTSESEVLCFGPTLLAKWPAGNGYLLGTAGWTSMRFVDGGHDVTGDGNPDVMAVTATGVLKIYESRRATTIVASTTLGSGWNAFTALFQVGDFSGDRRADLVGVDSLGKLWLYSGNGRGGFGSRTLIGSGWGGFGAVIPMRDFNGDGRADIGAITMDGKLVLYPGNGRAGFLPKKEIGTGWSAFL